MKLDYSIESPEERKKLVEQIIAETPNISSQYLEILANYLILNMEKQERKQRKILTENRMTTVNKRETSFEGLVGQLENGEDGIYNLITENKNTIFQPRISITKKDLTNIPYLQQLRDTIDSWNAALKRTSGKDAFTMKRALIDMRKDQYIIKQAYLRPIVPNKLIHTSGFFPKLDDESYVDEQGNLHILGFSLMDPKVISAILSNYSRLKQDSYDQFNGDTWYIMQDFDNLCERALAPYPLLNRIIECKVDGYQNDRIQIILQQEFGIKHSLEYLSSLWRNKIPKVIAKTAENEFLEFEYPRLGFKMKKCSRCGQLKPAHNNFFSKNKTSKDNFYSICKKCRNMKRG